MAPSDDDAENKGTDDGPKRPTPTIELEAEVVDQGAAEEADGAHSADNENGGANTGDGEPPAEPELPQGGEGGARAKGRAIAAVFSHMAAGLVGGLMGAAALAFWIGVLPTGLEVGGGAVSTGGEGQIGAVRGQIDALKTETEGSFKTLRDRLAKAEAALGARGAAGGDLAERLDKLESVRAAADGGGTADAAAEAALKTDLVALKTETAALTAQGEKLAQEIERLGAAIGQSGAPAADGAALGAVGVRVDDLEKKLGALNERQQAVSRDTQLAALAVALSGLKQAADSGSSYGAELDTVKSLMPGASNMARLDLKALEAGALTGVQSLGALRQSFDGYRRAALDAAAAPKSDALIDQITSRARALVRVRPSEPREGHDAGAVLARMEGHLRAGELAKAVSEAGALEGATAKAMAPWRKQAEARLGLDRGIQTLERAMLKPILDAAPAGNG